MGANVGKYVGEKVKFNLIQAMKAQREIKVIDLLVSITLGG